MAKKPDFGFWQFALILAFTLTLGIGIGLATYPVIFHPSTSYAIFSPGNGDEIIQFIGSAKETLDIEMYVMTSDKAVDAILAAKDRGVQVRVILEKNVMSADNDNAYARLSAAGIPVRWASRDFALTHAKFMVADSRRVLVGSHNLSYNALNKNREASAVLEGAVVSDFIAVFANDWTA